ncbi:MAG: SEC-C metal-binding domain-containing protein [Candidatus Eremiobacteraeota bacterium]|nr:SEC-C metal-binding domain-containing protein [Candidatus Eremiobacteraeota bacterium]
MNGARVTRGRQIDNGDPLMLWGPRDHAAAAPVGYAVSPRVCVNPQCDCTRIKFRIQRLAKDDKGLVLVEGPTVDGALDTRDGGVTLDDATSALAKDTVAWLRDRLGEDAQREWFRERFRRARGQIGDRAFPNPSLPDVDAMIFFSEVFPYDFDLTVFHDGRGYLVEDQYCMKPGCSCDELVVQFIDVSSERGHSVGVVRCDARRMNAPTIDGPFVLHRLWRNFLESYGPHLLRGRFDRMRALARPRATTTPAPSSATREVKVGRNDACPCGSGKKSKRCCGA